MAKKLSICVDPEIHRRLKIKAVEDDTSIQAFALEAIRKALDPDSKPGQAPATRLPKRQILRLVSDVRLILETGDQEMVTGCLADIRLRKRLLERDLKEKQ